MTNYAYPERSAIRAELDRFGTRRAATVVSAARAGGPDRVSAAKVLALCGRETGIRNICGGATWSEEEQRWIASYQDHGLVQISELWHREWLENHRGCKEGSYLGLYGSVLAKPRLVPRLTDQIIFACTKLDTLIESAERADALDPERVGVAAYNCGLHYALLGEKEHSNPDHFTAHQNYSYEIVKVRQPVVANWLREKKLT